MNQNLIQRCIRQKLSDLTMRTQISLISAFIFSIVVATLVLVQIVNLKLLTQIFSTSSEDIITNNQINYLENSAASLEDQINFFFQRTQMTLNKFNLLNNLIYHNKYTTFSTPQMCPFNSTTYSDEHYYSMPCIIYHDINDTVTMPNSNQDYQLRNLTQLFSSVIFEVDLGGDYIPNDLFFASVSNPNGFAYYYPPWEKYVNFNPKNRPWYKSHFEMLLKDPHANTQLSQVYKYYNDSNVYSMTMTQSMFNSSDQVDGIFAADILLQNKYFQNGLLNMMLVNYDGKLILTNYKNTNIANSTNFENFINQDVTGFNQTDWDCILQYIHDKITVSNCKSHQLGKILCRFNSVYKQDVIIVARQIKQLNYYLVVFNLIQDQIEIEAKISQLLNQFKSLYGDFILLCILCCILFLVIQGIAIILLCRPMHQIIRCSNLYLRSQNMIQTFKNSKMLQNWNTTNKFATFIQQYLSKLRKAKTENTSKNMLIQLASQFESLFDRVLASKTQKCWECQAIQSFKYPKDNHQNTTILSVEIEKVQFVHTTKKYHDILNLRNKRKLTKMFSL